VAIDLSDLQYTLSDWRGSTSTLGITEKVSTLN